MGEAGAIGYEGIDDSTFYTRMNRYGKSSYRSGSNIFYGHWTAFDIVMSFFMGDGDSSRGYRRNLFAADYSVTGVFSGPHTSLYGFMGCINYAGTYDNNEEQNQLDAQHADEDQSNKSDKQ